MSRCRVFPATLGALALATLPAGAQQSRVTTPDLPRGEWLLHGRDHGETRYSPLDQIDSGNVHRLGLAWSFEIEGSERDAVSTLVRLEATPIVAGGMLYATGVWNVVFALDARTGALQWKWDPMLVRGGRARGGPTVCCGPVNRGVALHNGKVYVGLIDGRLVALDAGTGSLVWVRQTTPPGTDYSITGAPRVVKGNVIIGNGGAEYGVRGYVTAYDAESGDQVWRTYTVPGNPSLGFESTALEFAATTWSGEWWTIGGGGTAWDSFSYDPEADLLYVGTGNGSPWSRQHRSGGTGDNLYLASILALDPDNGELVWYYQTVPGDDWDYTAVQQMILTDLVIDGRERKVLMQAPKNGFFYVLDRLTGELISAEKIGHATWAAHVDRETGRAVVNASARYDVVGSWVSPSTVGVHNWHPMSWNPQTGLVYIPAHTNQEYFRYNADFAVVPGRHNTGTRNQPQATTAPELPATPGYLLAWDPVAQRERWRIAHPEMRNGGTVTTAGNLVFSGRVDGRFYAHDAATGAELWEVQLPPRPATPITYELDGRQYVTILAGPGGTQGPPGRVYTFVLGGTARMPD